MFLEAIDEPRGLMMRLAWWWSARTFGKVMTPLKVVYARVPGALAISRSISKFLAAQHALDPALKLLVTQYVAEQNHCAFCVDIGLAIAQPGSKLREKLGALGDFQNACVLSDREKAALAFAQEWLNNRYSGGPARDALKGHFNDAEIVELVLVCACENYYNSINHALGIESDGLCALTPGK